MSKLHDGEYHTAFENEENSVQLKKQNYSSSYGETQSSSSLTSVSSQGSQKNSAGKSRWEWVELIASITVPLTIAMFGGLQWWADLARRDQDQEIATDNQHHEILSNYLDQMTQLQLNKELLKNLPAPEAQQIARARTLNALRQLDGERKGQLLKFLYEANLIGGQCTTNPRTLEVQGCKTSILKLEDARLDETTFNPPIPLVGIDLTKASLAEANLPGIDLTGANMQKVKLENANLTGTILTEAQMINARLLNADLVNATLLRANLSGAVLNDAVLRSTNFQEANLSMATLIGADLQGANFSNAKMQDADLRNADLSGASLQGTDLRGAKYNDATEFPEWFNPDGKGMELCTTVIERECK